MQTENIYNIENLTFAYSDRMIIDIPSLCIKKNRITVFLGENGSGKTTLLKLLGGLLIPSKGTIGCQHGEVVKNGKIHKNIVLVHQDPYLFSGSVYKNVAYGLKIRKIPKHMIKNKVREKLHLVGLDSFENRKSKEVSGGEKQRIALARALVLETDILLLDEPTGNIDADSTRLMQSLLMGEKEKGRTIIMSSHNYPFAYRISDDIIFLKNGKLIPNEFNFFHGEALREKNGFRIFECRGVHLKCPVQEGDFRTAIVSKNDVILSKQKIHTSAQNQLKGSVMKIMKTDSLYEIVLDCGIPIHSHITEKSFKELKIDLHKKYFVTFKSSAIKLY